MIEEALAPWGAVAPKEKKHALSINQSGRQNEM